eukprot:TRINITY_DN7276_c0_g1_i3.p1 TRINITY_DN7276_c0_g1~~TRINITY_DN7276_c0_g1_i3.p1  ORF type:complete len:1017 (+),score=193.67 TRINITY_DN7276_c0_g1_i3:82-3132(+)
MALSILNRLHSPVWLFDSGRMDMVWANDAAVRLWKSPDLASLLSRDFRTASEGVKQRNKILLQEISQGRQLIEQWTFHPHSQPVTVNCRCSGFVVTRTIAEEMGIYVALGHLNEKRAAGAADHDRELYMLVEGTSPDEHTAVSHDTMRMVECIRHTKVAVDEFCADDATFDDEPSSSGANTTIRRNTSSPLFGTIIIQNTASREVFGNLSMQERFVFPEDAKRARQALRETGGFLDSVKMNCVSGKRWYKVTARTALDPITGERVFIVNQTDVHELTKSQKRLRLSEQRLQESQEMAGLGSWKWSELEPERVTWTKNMFTIYGTPVAPYMLIRDIEAMYVPEDRERVIQITMHTFKDHLPVDTKARIIRTDGVQRVIHVVGNFSKVESRKTNASYWTLSGTTQDITDAYMTGQNLEEERQFVQALVASVDSGILACNSQGILTHCNRAAQELHGGLYTEMGDYHEFQPPSSMLRDQGHLLAKIQHLYYTPNGTPVPPSDIPLLAALSGKIIKDQEVVIVSQACPQHMLHRIQMSQDEKSRQTAIDEILNTPHAYYVLASGQVIIGPGGNKLGAVVSLHNITYRKRAEREILQAKEAAEQANQAKSNFLANISHEIRTPFNGILGWLNIALESQLTDDVRNFLQDAKDCTRFLLDLINTLLDFSQIEGGKFELLHVPFELRAGVEGLTRAFADTAAAKKVYIAVEYDESIPCVLQGDFGRLRQVISNLLDNALKFTNAEGNTVKLCVQRISPCDLYPPHANIAPSPPTSHDNSVSLHFSVSDQGIGIPKAKIPFVFDGFYQVDGSYSRKAGGVGLGLSICQRLVHLFGGYIWVDSVPGVGSTFHFTVRLAIPPAHVTTSITSGGGTSPPVAPRSPVHQSSPSVVHQVLVVDDNAMNRKLIARMLTNLGHRVCVAVDGISAIQTYQSKAGSADPVTCILMDIQMPDMSGIEATKRIREFELSVRVPRVHVCAVTAHAMKGDKERFLENNMDSYVSKPIIVKDLLAVLTAIPPPNHSNM